MNQQDNGNGNNNMVGNGNGVEDQDGEPIYFCQRVGCDNADQPILPNTDQDGLDIDSIRFVHLKFETNRIKTMEHWCKNCFEDVFENAKDGGTPHHSWELQNYCVFCRRKFDDCEVFVKYPNSSN